MMNQATALSYLFQWMVLFIVVFLIFLFWFCRPLFNNGVGDIINEESVWNFVGFQELFEDSILFSLDVKISRMLGPECGHPSV